MGAAHSAPLARVTLPDDVRLESLRHQLETLEEMCARRSPKLDWKDVDTSVLLHSACNALRNEKAILEHNRNSAVPRWRSSPVVQHEYADSGDNAYPCKKYCEALACDLSLENARGLLWKHLRLEKTHPACPKCRPRRTTRAPVAFSEDVAWIDASGALRDGDLFSDDSSAVAQQDNACVHVKTKIVGDISAASTPWLKDLNCTISVLSATLNAKPGAIVPYQKGNDLHGSFCDELAGIIVVHPLADTTMIGTLDAESSEIGVYAVLESESSRFIQSVHWPARRRRRRSSFTT
jgi:hypothetical protein